MAPRSGKIGRRLSNDRDAHPLSQRSGLDLEDLDAPSPSDKAVGELSHIPTQNAAEIVKQSAK